MRKGVKVHDLRVGEGAVAGRGMTVTVRYDGFACEGYTLDRAAPLIGELGDACEEATGVRPGLFASTATTDARTFQLFGGSPAVCFGPHAEAVHSIDERVYLPSVLHTAQALALFIGEWCGLEPADSYSVS